VFRACRSVRFMPAATAFRLGKTNRIYFDLRVVTIVMIISVGFEVLTAVSAKMAVLWVVAPCSLVEVYQRFRGP
jgi:hypothetical protein